MFTATAVAEEPRVNVYIWSDYLAEDTVDTFKAATSIEPVVDNYDSNETLEAKLFAGRSGYDVVFPSAHPFAARHIKANLYRPLDKALLPNLANLDPALVKRLESVDPKGEYLVPYMWGTTGIGYNVEQVKKALGEDAPVNSWALIFDPQYASKLKECGISMLDDEQEAFAAALLYLGKDANSTDKKDLQAAQELLRQARAHVRYFHSSQYINDLANGSLCVALGYSGDVLQARDRAAEAAKPQEIAYNVPKEGAVLWFDVMAIPLDAPHPQAAHAFINHLLDPAVIAGISNYVNYANPNLKATELLDEAVRNDLGIYPSAETMARLVVPEEMPRDVQRQRVRGWTAVKSGR